MKNTWLMAVVALLVLSAAACKKENKAEQLAALDNAYQSGVLTKAEYDAKRLALVGPAAPPPAAANTPPAPADAVQPSAAPAPPKAAPRKLAPGAARSQAATERPVPAPAVPPESTPASPNASQPPPVTEPPAAPTAQVREPSAAQTRPAPPTSAAGEAEGEPQPLAGCEDAEYQSGKVKGARRRFYPAPMDSVRRAAGAALRSLDFTIHREGGNEMEASKRRHISAIVGAGGERLILRFEKSQQGNQAGTMVTGETKKSLVGRVAQKSWTNAVLAQIACHLRARR
ncbi:MAG: hypothetical protein ABSC05_05130 [Candidatus Solibacter sp.]|jgi:hypothetical protein